MQPQSPSRPFPPAAHQALASDASGAATREVTLHRHPGPGAEPRASHGAVRGARPRSSRLSLTARELEVLRLLVRRRTDMEIAEQLYVSYRTVTTHVANIRRKLGARSRYEAVDVAVQRDLV